ncbi:hypothetical protein EAV90_26795 [Bradyrhizobium vignae]|nr:hypothetical protein EAV90_26795 [Bradyrhizobium vignae]
MRQAAVFVDANEEASCVPPRRAGKIKSYQSDASLADFGRRRSAASCLSGCTSFVRRTRIEQCANFASGTSLRQSGTVHLSY